jgi:hypothetical protein
MAGRAFRRRITAIRDGEAVAAAVAGRPDADLQDNISYVLDLIDDIAGGQGATRHRATLDPALLPGQAAYWDVGTQRFAPGLAAVTEDTPTGGLVLAASCDVVGVVLFKENPTLGDVLLAGYGQVDLAAALQDGGPVLPGRYYLSSSRPGMLTRQRPALSVAVLVADGIGGVYVQPTLRNFLEDHVHYEARLHARPAGGNGGTTVIAPDPTVPGWLPGDHPSFAGKAPVGCAFGYNLKADLTLVRLWPPLPIASAQIFWDRGQGQVGATVVPKGTNGLVAIDRDGIWWMSNAPGDIPWPADFAGVEVEAPPNSSSGPEVPRLEDMRIVLTFTRMLFATDKSVVTSIRPLGDSPIFFRDCDGEPASAGDLYAGIDLSFVEAEELISGGIAFKTLDGSTFRRGWMVEGIRAGANCRILSTHTAVRGSVAVPYTLHQGEVIIDVLADRGELALSPQIERLGDAQQRFHLDVPYIGFGADRQSGLRYVFDVPPSGILSAPRFRLRLRLLGRSGGALPALTLTCRRLARPAPGVVTALPGPAAEQPLAFPSAGVAVTPDGYVEVESDAVEVAAGDTVLVQLLRARGDGYAGEVGVLRSEGIITGEADNSSSAAVSFQEG